MRRIEIWLLLAVVLLAGAWAVVWWLISSHVQSAVDEALAASSEGEVAITCDDRAHGGFPFRFEMVCRGAAARATDGAWGARLERLRAGALLRSPRNIEASFEGPLAVDTPALDRPVTADWASAGGELDAGEDGPKRLLLRLFSATAEVAEARLAVHQARLELAPNEAGGSRIGLAVEQLRVATGEEALPPIDLALQAQVPVPAEALLAGAIDRSEGLSVTDIALSLETRRMEAHLQGALDFDPVGLASGSLTLTLVGIEELPTLIEALPEGARSGANVGVGALMALAAPAEWRGRPARRIVLTIEDGEVRAGALSLGRLPPLWEAPASS